MLQAVKDRLASLGITVSSEPGSFDSSILQFALDKVTNHVKNQTNLLSIPDGLYHIAIDMIAGEYLFVKKSMGQLSLETLDFGLFAKQIQEGDTTILYAESSSPEVQFNAFIDYLRHDNTDFVKYRVLTW